MSIFAAERETHRNPHEAPTVLDAEQALESARQREATAEASAQRTKTEGQIRWEEATAQRQEAEAAHRKALAASRAEVQALLLQQYRTAFEDLAEIMEHEVAAKVQAIERLWAEAEAAGVKLPLVLHDAVLPGCIADWLSIARRELGPE